MKDPGGYIGEALVDHQTAPYIVSVVVPGTAKGQPRPRAFSRGGHAAVYDPGTAEGWKSAIAEAFKSHRPAMPLRGGVRVWIKAFFSRPRSHYRKNGEVTRCAALNHCQKPDADNMAKAVLDALTTIGIWHDDAQVHQLSVSRAWTTGASETEIRVEAADDLIGE